MQSNSKLSFASALIMFASLSACTKEEPPKPPVLGFEEVIHNKRVDDCVYLMVSAGARVIDGDEVLRQCRLQDLTRPQIAQYEIMKVLKEKELLPKETISLYLLPPGECKEVADKYVSLQEEMYHSNPGPERTANEAESTKIMAQVQAGECPIIPKPVAKV